MVGVVPQKSIIRNGNEKNSNNYRKEFPMWE